ncbi:MAG TPA: PEPxxWA-CTERM sorting domain-containing protein [Sphingomonas sp.]|nr:PEPxxWA-CTERM sorting domain-containing protein [Sphingomonas sp.]
MLKKLMVCLTAAFAALMAPAAAEATVIQFSYDGTLAGSVNGFDFDTAVTVNSQIDPDSLFAGPLVDLTHVTLDAPAVGITGFALPDLQLLPFPEGFLLGVNDAPFAAFGLDFSTAVFLGNSVSVDGGLISAIPFTLNGLDFELTGGEGTFTFTIVPEAATWAMMILGFGLVGAAARRRSPAKAVLA